MTNKKTKEKEELKESFKEVREETQETLRNLLTKTSGILEKLYKFKPEISREDPQKFPLNHLISDGIQLTKDFSASSYPEYYKNPDSLKEVTGKFEEWSKKVADITEEKVKTSDTAMEKLLAKVEELERKDIENQKQLKMLYNVADKGRVFNYENSTKEKKPFKIKLSIFDGKIIIGWRNAKDILVKHPQTGATVGEEQQMEVILLDNAGQQTTHLFNGYSAFSNAKYDQRIDCEVISKEESYEGRLTYNVVLPDGRTINLAAAFVN